MKKNQKGFTLVELMIVVAIIGILAAIAIPKFADMLEKSREGATKGNLSSINSGIALFVSDNQGQGPQSLDTATTYIAGSGIQYSAFIPTYMDTLPGVKATAKRKSQITGWNNWTDPSRGGNTVTTYAGLPGALLTAAGTGAGGWLYNPIGSAGGNFWVNSRAGDMKSIIVGTTSIYEYTMYGYE
jgi:prepilin-type N-terminal cleavage/methylation domain-containing protein